MKKFARTGQRTLKIFHLLMASLWIGGAIGLNIMIIGLGGAESRDQLLAFDLARKFVDDFFIIPGALGTLLSGILICWLTPYGFFKHRWIIVKLVLTILCILFGTFILGPYVNEQPTISASLGLLAHHDQQYLGNIRGALFGGAIQICVIIFMTTISVIKPWNKKKAEKNISLSS